MKEAKVLKPFTDRYTGRLHQKGETYQGTEDRVAELQANKYLGKATDDVQADKRPGAGAADS